MRYPSLRDWPHQIHAGKKSRMQGMQMVKGKIEAALQWTADESRNLRQHVLSGGGQIFIVYHQRVGA